MNNKVVVGLVVLLVGVGAGWYFLQGGKPAPESIKNEEEVLEITATPASEPLTTLGTEPSVTGSVMAKTSVSYGTGGFVPNTVTVKIGTTVVWTNQSQSGMWVASAMHPTHQLLPGFDQLKSVSAGSAYEYTFEKVGTWKYHNHMAPADTGTVVVTE